MRTAELILASLLLFLSVNAFAIIQPSQPSTPYRTGSSYNYINIAFYTPASNGATIVGYEVRIWGGSVSVTHADTSLQLSRSFTPLAPGKVFQFDYRALVANAGANYTHSAYSSKLSYSTNSYGSIVIQNPTNNRIFTPSLPINTNFTACMVSRIDSCSSVDTRYLLHQANGLTIKFVGYYLYASADGTSATENNVYAGCASHYAIRCLTHEVANGTGTIALWENQNQLFQKTFPATSYGGSGVVAIGSDVNGNFPNYGRVDDIFIVNRVLGPLELSAYASSTTTFNNRIATFSPVVAYEGSAYYPYNAAGNVMHDYSGNNRHATLSVGTPSFTISTELRNYAVSQYTTMGAYTQDAIMRVPSPWNGTSDSFTFCAWMYPIYAGRARFAVADDKTTPTAVIAVTGTTLTVANTTVTFTEMSASQWRLECLVKDGSVITYNRNGDSIASLTLPTGTMMEGDLYFANGVQSVSTPFFGYIIQMRGWKRALSFREISMGARIGIFSTTNIAFQYQPNPIPATPNQGLDDAGLNPPLTWEGNLKATWRYNSVSFSGRHITYGGTNGFLNATAIKSTGSMEWSMCFWAKRDSTRLNRSEVLFSMHNDAETMAVGFIEDSLFVWQYTRASDNQTCEVTVPHTDDGQFHSWCIVHQGTNFHLFRDTMLEISTQCSNQTGATLTQYGIQSSPSLGPSLLFGLGLYNATTSVTANNQTNTTYSMERSYFKGVISFVNIIRVALDRYYIFDRKSSTSTFGYTKTLDTRAYPSGTDGDLLHDYSGYNNHVLFAGDTYYAVNYPTRPIFSTPTISLMYVTRTTMRIRVNVPVQAGQAGITLRKGFDWTNMVDYLHDNTTQYQYYEFTNLTSGVYYYFQVYVRSNLSTWTSSSRWSTNFRTATKLEFSSAPVITSYNYLGMVISYASAVGGCVGTYQTWWGTKPDMSDATLYQSTTSTAYWINYVKPNQTFYFYIIAVGCDYNTVNSDPSPIGGPYTSLDTARYAYLTHSTSDKTTVTGIDISNKSFSVCMHLVRTNSAQNFPFMSQGSVNAFPYFEIYHNYNGQINVTNYHTNQSDPQWFTAEAGLMLSWTPWCYVYDMPSKVSRMYIDGTLKGTYTNVEPIRTVNATMYWFSRQSGVSFWGSADRVALYNRTLTETEVTGYMFGGTPSGGLVAYYDMEPTALRPTTPSLIYDSSGNGHHAQIDTVSRISFSTTNPIPQTPPLLLLQGGAYSYREWTYPDLKSSFTHCVTFDRTAMQSQCLLSVGTDAHDWVHVGLQTATTLVYSVLGRELTYTHSTVINGTWCFRFNHSDAMLSVFAESSILSAGAYHSLADSSLTINSTNITTISDTMDSLAQSQATGLWQRLSGYQYSAACGASGGSALLFNRLGDRILQSSPIYTAPGGNGTISYLFRLSDGPADAYCEGVDIGEDVVMEYSLDGASWVEFDRLAYTMKNSSLAPRTTVFAPAMIGTSAQFRWRQLAHSGQYSNDTFDSFVLENVTVSFTGQLAKHSSLYLGRSHSDALPASMYVRNFISFDSVASTAQMSAFTSLQAFGPETNHHTHLSMMPYSQYGNGALATSTPHRLQDVSGNGHHFNLVSGVYVPAATLPELTSDVYLRFDGVSSTVRSQVLSLSGWDFTITFWTRRTRNNTAEGLIAHGTGVNGATLLIGFDANNNLFATMDPYSVNYVSVPHSPNGVWHRWNIVYRRSQRLLEVYRDGRLGNTTITNTYYSGSSAFHIGSFYHFNSSLPYAGYQGDLDSLFVTNYAYSSTHVNLYRDHTTSAGTRYVDLSFTPMSTDRNRVAVTNADILGNAVYQVGLPSMDWPTVSVAALANRNSTFMNFTFSLTANAHTCAGFLVSLYNYQTGVWSTSPDRSLTPFRFWTNLLPSYTYKVDVLPLGIDGLYQDGSVTSSASYATYPRPSIPSAPSVTAVTTVSLALSTAVSANGATVTSYTVLYALNPNMTNSSSVETGSSSTAYTLTGLQPSTSYYVRFIARASSLTQDDSEPGPIGGPFRTYTQYVYANTSEPVYRSCAEHLAANSSNLGRDGLYMISSAATDLLPTRVYCDMTTDGGGWTLLGWATDFITCGAFNAPCGDYGGEGRASSAQLNLIKHFRYTAGEIAFSWKDNSAPAGNMSSYQAAMKFHMPSAAVVSSWSGVYPQATTTKPCSDPAFQAVDVACIHGNCQMPSSMYLGVTGGASCIGRGFGVIASSTTTCDYYLTTSTSFNALYVAPPTVGTECQGYRDSTLAVKRAGSVGIWGRPRQPKFENVTLFSGNATHTTYRVNVAAEGAIISLYEITVLNGTQHVVFSANYTSPLATVAGLTVNTPYYIRVQYTPSGDQDKQSAFTSGVEGPFTVRKPNITTAPYSTDSNATSLTVTWGINTMGANISGYVVSISSFPNMSNATSHPDQSPSQQRVFTNLESNAAFYVSVYAMTSHPWEIYSETRVGEKLVVQSAGALRLIDPNNAPYKGRIEIFNAGLWGTVCDDQFFPVNAKVVCFQLGFAKDPAHKVLNKYFPGSGVIQMDSVQCRGNETQLQQCPFNGWQVTDCTHAEDVAVECVRATALMELPTLFSRNSSSITLRTPHVAQGAVVEQVKVHFSSDFNFTSEDIVHWNTNASFAVLRTFSGLQPNTAYYFRSQSVVRVSDFDADSFSPTAIITSGALAQVVSITSRSGNSSQLTIVVQGSAPGGEVAGYRVRISPHANMTASVTHTSTANVSDFTFYGLAPTSTHYASVQVIGGVNTDDSAVQVAGPFQVRAIPSILSPPVLVNISLTSLAVRVEQVYGNGANVSGYVFKLSSSPDMSSAILHPTNDTSSIRVFTNLSPNTQYYVSVIALAPPVADNSLESPVGVFKTYQVYRYPGVSTPGMRSCQHHLAAHPELFGQDGVYNVSFGNETLSVYCDMSTGEGGWTLLAWADGFTLCDQFTSACGDYGYHTAHHSSAQLPVHAFLSQAGAMALAWSPSPVSGPLSSYQVVAAFNVSLSLGLGGLLPPTARAQQGCDESAGYYAPTSVTCLSSDCSWPQSMHVGAVNGSVCSGQAFGVVGGAIATCDDALTSASVRGLYLSPYNTTCKGLKHNGQVVTNGSSSLWARPRMPATRNVTMVNASLTSMTFDVATDLHGLTLQTHEIVIGHSRAELVSALATAQKVTQRAVFHSVSLFAPYLVGVRVQVDNAVDAANSTLQVFGPYSLHRPRVVSVVLLSRNASTMQFAWTINTNSTVPTQYTLRYSLYVNMSDAESVVVAAPETSVYIHTLAPRQLYYITVRAHTSPSVINHFDSEWSSVTGPFGLHDRPATPAPVTLVAYTATSVTVAYVQPETFGVSVDGYSVVASRFASMSDPIVHPDNSTSLQRTFTALNISTDYYFTVQLLTKRAFADNSYPSTPASFRTKDKAATPATPVELSTGLGNCSVALTAPEARGTEIVGFAVRISADQSMKLSFTHEDTSLSLTRDFNSLPAGMWYFIDYKAITNTSKSATQEDSEYSAPLRVYVPGQPDTPQTPTLGSRTAFELTITIRPPVFQLNTSSTVRISGFEVQMSQYANMTDAVFHPDTTMSTARTFTGLSRRTTYYFTVRSISDSNLPSTPCEATSFSTLAKPLTPFPPHRTWRNVTSFEVSLNFSLSAFDDQANITEVVYRISFNREMTSGVVVHSDTSVTSSRVFTGLNINSLYYVDVLLKASGLNSEDSARSVSSEGIRTLNRPSSPGLPVRVYSLTGAYSIGVDFLASNIPSGVTVRYYELQISSDASMTTVMETRELTVLTTQFTGLERGTVYYFRARAISEVIDVSENSIWTSVNGIRTLYKPDTPAPPVMIKRSTTAIELRAYLPAYLNFAYPSAFVFRISPYANMSNTQTVSVVHSSPAVNVSYAVFTGLAINSQWYADVQVACFDMNMEDSNTSAPLGPVSTLGKPFPPPSPNVIRKYGTQLNISLAPAAENGASIAGYAVRISDKLDMSTSFTHSDNSTQLFRVFDGLSISTNYFFDVRALVRPEHGDSSEFSSVGGPFETLAQPSTPTPPVVDSFTNGVPPATFYTLRVKCDPPASNKAPLEGYRFAVSRFANMTGVFVHPDVGLGLTRTFTDLRAGTPYYFTVQAISETASSQSSAWSAVGGPYSTISDQVSNAFVSGPTELSGTNLDSASLSLVPSATGRAWVMLLKNILLPSASIVSVKAGQEAVGAATCRFMNQSVTELQPVTVSLTACSFTAGITYAAAVYVEDNANNNDGVLSFLPLSVPSNDFGVKPHLLPVPIIDTHTFAVRYSVQFVGYSWGVIFRSADADTVTRSDIVGSNQGAQVGPGKALTCRWTGAYSATANAFSTHTLTGCDLLVDTNYTLFVYVDDVDSGTNDGSLAALTFPTPSNAFTTSGIYVIGQVLFENMTIGYVPKGSGYSWGYTVLSSVDVSSLSASAMKSGAVPSIVGESACRWSRVPVTAYLESNHTLFNCSLVRKQGYKVIVYVESTAGGGDGIASSVSVAGPSNSFVTPPVISDYSLTGVTVAFAPVFTGTASLSIIHPSSLPTLTAAQAKSGSRGIGGSSCRLIDQEVASSQLRSLTSFKLTSCGMSLLTLYYAVVYVEDSTSSVGQYAVAEVFPSANNTLLSFEATLAFAPGFSQSIRKYDFGRVQSDVVQMKIRSHVDSTATLQFNTTVAKSGEWTNYTIKTGENMVPITVTSRIGVPNVYFFSIFRRPVGAASKAANMTLHVPRSFPTTEAEKAAYIKAFVIELAASLGVLPSQINVNGLEQGSIIVHFTVTPPPDAQLAQTFDPAAVIADVQQQVANASSSINTGNTTGNATLTASQQTELQLCGDGTWKPAGECTTVMCADNVCQNGGTCTVDSNGDYQCACASGWMGALCADPVPAVAPQTLLLVSGNSSINGTNATTIQVRPGDVIRFTPVLASYEKMVSAFYGPDHDNKRFECLPTNVTAYVHLQASVNDVFCTINLGFGSGLRFLVRVNDTRFNSITERRDKTLSQTLQYPPPIIKKNTLRRTGVQPTQDANNQTTVVGRSLKGGSLTFEGQLFWPNTTELKVYYGPVTNRRQYQCLVTESHLTNITCDYQEGEGKNNSLTVELGGVFSEVGEDIFNYPTPPQIDVVIGCSGPTTYTAYGNGTSECSTDALSGNSPILLTMIGTQLADPLGVTIAGKECSFIEFLDPGTRIRCRLPAGAGFNAPVLAIQGEFVSVSAPLVNYARPTISYLSTNSSNATGCHTDPLNYKNLVNCNRYGGDWITIHGANFGASNAQVLIGGQECKNVFHFNHRKLACLAPAGSALERSIILIQDQGELSEIVELSQMVTLSYKQCDPGYILSGLDCLPCPRGSYSPAKGQTECKICDIGTFANDTGLSSCIDCPAGTYQANQNASACSACAPGSYIATPGAPACFLCKPGTASSAVAATSCSDCGPGLFSAVQGGVQCLSCLPGRYSQGAAPSCEPCSEGTYAPDYNSTNCRPCWYFSDSFNGTTCKCKPGYYETPLGGGTSMCESCPLGADCAVPGTVRSDVLPLAGYYPGLHSNKDLYFECLSPACLGSDSPLSHFAKGSNGSLSFLCEEGYHGPLCDVCKDGYGRVGEHGCGKCPSMWETEVQLSFAIIGAIIGLGLFAWNSIKHATDDTAVESILVKVVMSSLQFNAIAASFNFKWPSAVESLLGAQQKAGGLGASILSFDCLIGAENSSRPFYVQSLVFLFVPLMVIILPWVALKIWSEIQKCRRNEFSEKTFHNHYVATVIVILFFLHPSLVQQAFFMVSCKRIGAEKSDWYLIKDLSQQCAGKQHIYWVVFVALPMMALYVIGIPSLAFHILRQNRNKLKRTSFKKQFSFLYLGYNKDRYYWELVVVARKVILSAIIVFFAFNFQIQAIMAMLLCALALMAHVYGRPFEIAILDWAEFFSLITSFVTFWAGQFLFVPEIDEQGQIILSCIIVGINVMFWLWAIYQYVKAMLASKKQAKEKEQIEAEQEAKKERKEIVVDAQDVELALDPRSAKLLRYTMAKDAEDDRVPDGVILKDGHLKLKRLHTKRPPPMGEIAEPQLSPGRPSSRRPTLKQVLMGTEAAVKASPDGSHTRRISLVAPDAGSPVTPVSANSTSKAYLHDGASSSLPPSPNQGHGFFRDGQSSSMPPSPNQDMRRVGLARKGADPPESPMTGEGSPSASPTRRRRRHRLSSLSRTPDGSPLTADSTSRSSRNRRASDELPQDLLRGQVQSSSRRQTKATKIVVSQVEDNPPVPAPIPETVSPARGSSDDEGRSAQPLTAEPRPGPNPDHARESPSRKKKHKKKSKRRGET